MKRLSCILGILLVASNAVIYAGNLKVIETGTPANHVDVQTKPVKKVYKGSIPYTVNVELYTIPTRNDKEGNSLLQKIKDEVNAQIQSAHYMSYGEVLSLKEPTKVLSALKKLKIQYFYDQYEYSGLNKRNLNINRYAHLNYSKTYKVAGIKLQNSENKYFEYGFNIKTDLNNHRVSLETYYDSSKPLNKDDVNLPNIEQQSFQEGLQLGESQSIASIWQNNSVSFKLVKKKQVLVPSHTLNIALISFTYYPGYFKAADKKALEMRKVLDV